MKKRVFLLTIFLFWPLTVQAAIAVVQSVSANATGVDSVTTGSLTTTSGNLFICDAVYYTNASFNSITDSKSNIYVNSVAESSATVDSSGKIRQQYKENG